MGSKRCKYVSWSHLGRVSGSDCNIVRIFIQIELQTSVHSAVITE